MIMKTRRIPTTLRLVLIHPNHVSVRHETVGVFSSIRELGKHTKQGCKGHRIRVIVFPCKKMKEEEEKEEEEEEEEMELISPSLNLLFCDCFKQQNAAEVKLGSENSAT